MTWNTRECTASDQRRLRDLADLHSLSLALLREMQVEAPTQALDPELTALASPEARRHDSPLLESMLDERQAPEILEALAARVTDVHLATVEAVNSKRLHPLGEGRILQAAWDEGRRAARLRWPEIAEHERRDLRDILSAVSDSAIAPALVRRATAPLVELELNGCPHTENSRLRGPALELICQIHRSYRQGFVQELNPRVKVSSERVGEICSQVWRL